MLDQTSIAWRQIDIKRIVGRTCQTLHHIDRLKKMKEIVYCECKDRSVSTSLLRALLWLLWRQHCAEKRFNGVTDKSLSFPKEEVLRHVKIGNSLIHILHYLADYKWVPYSFNCSDHHTTLFAFTIIQIQHEVENTTKVIRQRKYPKLGLSVSVCESDDGKWRWGKLHAGCGVEMLLCMCGTWATVSSVNTAPVSEST
jgi:hypothetical protein